jgi:hypothetical protein
MPYVRVHILSPCCRLRQDDRGGGDDSTEQAEPELVELNRPEELGGPGNPQSIPPASQDGGNDAGGEEMLAEGDGVNDSVNDAEPESPAAPAEDPASAPEPAPAAPAPAAAPAPTAAPAAPAPAGGSWSAAGDRSALPIARQIEVGLLCRASVGIAKARREERPCLRKKAKLSGLWLQKEAKSRDMPPRLTRVPGGRMGLRGEARAHGGSPAAAGGRWTWARTSRRCG